MVLGHQSTFQNCLSTRGYGRVMARSDRQLYFNNGAMIGGLSFTRGDTCFFFGKDHEFSQARQEITRMTICQFSGPVDLRSVTRLSWHQPMQLKNNGK